jgi:outer membrane lipase/esterase
MLKFTRYGLAAGLAAVLAWGLNGCGGNDSLPTKASISKVYVMGDSLADVGTFSGLKYTVQDASNPKGFPIWPQIVASNFGLNALSQCNAFSGVITSNDAGDWVNETYSDNTTLGCTNYAIGSGRIYVPVDPLNLNASATSASRATNPRNISNQFAKINAYAATDLVLIVGGGNDAADLVGKYLGAAQGLTGAASAYQNFLLQQLSIPVLTGIMTANGAVNGPGVAAGAYMQTLANTFYASIKTNVLDKGATKVAILNMPDITITPRFQMVLASLGANGPAVQGAIQQWISAFNTQLKTNIANDSRIALVDFYSDIQDTVKNPASYGLTNAILPACPATGVDSTGLPTYTFPTCTSTALDATAGKTAGWWKTYAFSDGFHPTPMGHSLFAASVSRALARAGWL